MIKFVREILKTTVHRCQEQPYAEDCLLFPSHLLVGAIEPRGTANPKSLKK
jgi:hypothetical protein